MSKLPIIIFLAVIILVGGAFYFFNAYPRTLDTTETFSPSPIASANPTESTAPVDISTDSLNAGGNSYLDRDGLYNFLYPNDFKLDESDPKHIRIYKQGPTQKGQTEMYDGIIMVFETVSLENGRSPSSNKNLSQWTDDYIKSATSDGTSKVTDPKKTYSLKDYPGFTFKMQGLGDAQYYVIQKDSASKNALLITTMVTDPTNAGFQKQVDNSLMTINLLK